MNYRKFQDMNISLLGMGTMRLPILNGDDGAIDVPQVQQMVDLAMESGINYFDTAWGYHDGHSEEVVGQCLQKYPRESFYLATKFPGYDLANMSHAEEIFEKQLEKCGVDYFDFYLFHNVCEMNIDAYLDEERYGVHRYLAEQKRRGRIRHLGFSNHGGLPVLERFLKAYGADMEFCQIQLNWLDWEFQDAKEAVEMLRAWNLPIWVMEPLRGGRLARLTEEDMDRLRAVRSEGDAVDWAFRFVRTIPGVTTILSGASSLAQLTENIRLFEQPDPDTESEAGAAQMAAEREALFALAREMTSRTSVPCTACKYCMSHCPQGLNIPGLLSLYNEHAFTGGGFIAPMALEAIPPEKQPSACIACGSCEAVCPQQIKVSAVMADFCERLK